MDIRGRHIPTELWGEIIGHLGLDVTSLAQTCVGLRDLVRYYDPSTRHDPIYTAQRDAQLEDACRDFEVSIAAYDRDLDNPGEDSRLANYTIQNKYRRLQQMQHSWNILHRSCEHPPQRHANFFLERYLGITIVIPACHICQPGIQREAVFIFQQHTGLLRRKVSAGAEIPRFWSRMYITSPKVSYVAVLQYGVRNVEGVTAANVYQELRQH